MFCAQKTPSYRQSHYVTAKYTCIALYKTASVTVISLQVHVLDGDATLFPVNPGMGYVLRPSFLKGKSF